MTKNQGTILKLNFEIKKLLGIQNMATIGRHTKIHNGVKTIQVYHVKNVENVCLDWYCEFTHENTHT